MKHPQLTDEQMALYVANSSPDNPDLTPEGILNFKLGNDYATVADLRTYVKTLVDASDLQLVLAQIPANARVIRNDTNTWWIKLWSPEQGGFQFGFEIHRF